MLGAYLNQTAEFKPCTGTDDRGQPVYGEPVTVYCRRQKQVQNILTASGQTIQTQHVYYLKDEVHEGDMLDGKIVTEVFTWTGLHGETIGCKAVV